MGLLDGLLSTQGHGVLGGKAKQHVWLYFILLVMYVLAYVDTCVVLMRNFVKPFMCPLVLGLLCLMLEVGARV